MTVSQLLREADSKELTEWAAYYLSKDETWNERQKREKEVKKTNAISDAEYSKIARKIFKGS